MDIDFGWYADTIHFGDYPALVKARFGEHLPVFTPEERALLTRSYDYMGMTLYTAKVRISARVMPCPTVSWGGAAHAALGALRVRAVGRWARAARSTRPLIPRPHPVAPRPFLQWAMADPQKETGYWVVTKDSNGNPIGEQAESYWCGSPGWCWGRAWHSCQQCWGRTQRPGILLA